MGKRVMVVGIDPDVVDLAPFPQLTKQDLRAGLEREFAALRALGYQVRPVMLDYGATAEAVAARALMQFQPDCVCIGAGVRLPPSTVALFEKLVNLVHRTSPNAVLCFNTGPGDTAAAVQRWL